MSNSNVNDCVKQRTNGEFCSVEVIYMQCIIVMMQGSAEAQTMRRRSQAAMSARISIRFAKRLVERPLESSIGLVIVVYWKRVIAAI